MTPVTRWPVSLALVVLASGLMSVACGSTTVRTTNSSCGAGYAFIAEGHRSAPLDCALTLPYPPTVTTVYVGERFSIDVPHDANGKLLLPVPRPKPHAPVRLTHRLGSRVFYLATRRGSAPLWVDSTSLCPKLNPKVGSCVVFRVTVTG